MSCSLCDEVGVVALFARTSFDVIAMDVMSLSSAPAVSRGPGPRSSCDIYT